MNIIAIDPGPTKSAMIVWKCRDWLTEKRISANEDILKILRDLRYRFPPDDNLPYLMAIEQVSHYGTGMPVGESVFETCVWTGRFIETVQPAEVVRVKRQQIKTHLCGTPRAKDANIRQALIDRFGPPGTGFLYGIKSHLWAAMALAVYVRDTQLKH